MIGYNPTMVTDGLVLCLDAANGRSYPGSGTAWSDLSGNGNNGTLTNGPTYSANNLGYFQFATDDYITMPNNTSLDTQTPSVEVWIKTNALAQNGFWFEKGAVNTQYSLFQEGVTIVWRQRYSDGVLRSLTVNTSNYLTTTSWFQIVGTFVSGAKKLYINTNLANSNTQTGVLATNSNGMSIGAYGGTTAAKSYYYNGNLAICRVYNKVLTPAEIQQNFNATRGRFGI
jgi:hypothetical protein